MPLLPGPDNLWCFVAVIAGALVVACLRLIGHAYHDAVRWHDLRVRVQRLRAEQQRRLDKLARIEAGVNRRASPKKRNLPENLREPIAGAPVDVLEEDPAGAVEAVEPGVEMAEAA